MTTATAPDTWLAAWPSTPAELSAGASSWIRERRTEALEHFRAAGFPTTRQEAWQYTNVSAIARTVWKPALPPDAAARTEAERLLQALPRLGSAKRLVFVNGYLAPWLDDGKLAPDGVSVMSLAALLDQDPAALKTTLGTLVSGDGHAFAALNTALFTDGAVLHVGENVDVDEPIHLVFLGVGKEEALAAHTRLLIALAPGSRAAVVETWAGRTQGRWLENVAVETWIGKNAHLDVLEIQRQPLEALHFRSMHVRQERDSAFTSTCLSLGARLARNDVRVELAGEGASCRVDGLSLVSGTQHVDHQTAIDHAVPNGSSRQLYKGLLDDTATAAFSGLVHVRPHAQKTDAQQANHNLLLSRDARADSKPQLEIFADDVKCAHGATVGQLDEDAVFYLRSRGLGERAARRLLLRAFAAEVPGRIEDECLKAHAEHLIERRLPGVA